MILVTRLDGSRLVINSDLLESVEPTPDTVLSLVNGHKLVVRESVEQVIRLVVEYRRRINRCPVLAERPALAAALGPAEGARTAEGRP